RRRKVAGQRRWSPEVLLTDEHVDDPVDLFHRVRPDAGLPDQRVVGIADDRRQAAVLESVGEAVVPACDRALGQAHRLRRELHAAVDAAVGYGVGLTRTAT